MTRSRLRLLLLSLILSSAAAVLLAEQRTEPAAAGRPLVQPSTLVHQGTFKVPTGIRSGGQANAGFEYGGGALGFNPTRNSLFIVGHDWDQFLGEISIPAVGGTARLLQPLTDASEGKGVGSGSTKVGGTLVHDGQLYFTKFLYYDGAGAQTESLFVRPLDLSVKGQVRGPYRVGPLGAGFYSGYMTSVPTSLQAALGGPALIGNCCLNIISRTSYGPAAFVIDPRVIGKDPAANPLVYYPSTNPTLGQWNGATDYFGGSDSVGGFVVPDGYGSVLFFGRHGTTFCYGGANCNDPTSSSQGVHGYPYLSYVWAYSIADLSAVRVGRRQPWDVKPYAVWTLPELGGRFVGGAAYDPVSHRLFISQLRGEQERPLIHVYAIPLPPQQSSQPPR